MLNKEKLKQGFQGTDLEIYLFNSVTSTNDIAKEYANKDKPNELALLIAKEQTHGRGRYGKRFYSKLHEGLYLSLVVPIKNKASMNDIPLTTIATASALVLAVEEVVGLKLDIKWVNDLFYQGYKIGGILCESIINRETHQLESVIIGVGMNLAGDFKRADTTIQNVAGTLFGNKVPESVDLEQLIIHFVHFIKTYIEKIEKKEFLPVYESHLLGVGQRVSYEGAKGRQQGIILGINKDGHLLVEHDNCEIVALFGQEIHLSSSQFLGNVFK